MIHLIYPHNQDRIHAPWSIGNHLLSYLRAHGKDVTIHEWTDRKRLYPARTDTLIGHPHPEPGYIYETNLHKDWLRTIAICPWTGETDGKNDALMGSDVVLPICGPEWASEVDFCAIDRLDMAIDLADWPKVKQGFAPIGKRRVIYIGCTLAVKGADYLSQIAAELPEVEFHHVGYGIIPGTFTHGYKNVTSEFLANFDIVIAPGIRDANPTFILEGIASGLVPVCTKTSGWGPELCTHIPLDSPSEAGRILDNLLKADKGTLERLASNSLDKVKTLYTWDIFCSKVLRAIDG